MSLNHKRRIFRPNGRASMDGWYMPAPAVMLAAAGGAVTLLVVATLFVRPSDAPARAPADVHISAPADALAALDGATLRVGQQVVRLEGITPPVRGSSCRQDAGIAIDCATAAANALARLISRASVDCAIHGRDGFGRPVGDCMSGRTRINEALVRQGWAHADTDGLRQAERDSQESGRGLWRSGS